MDWGLVVPASKGKMKRAAKRTVGDSDEHGSYLLDIISSFRVKTDRTSLGTSKVCRGSLAYFTFRHPNQRQDRSPKHVA